MATRFLDTIPDYAGQAQNAVTASMLAPPPAAPKHHFDWGSALQRLAMDAPVAEATLKGDYASAATLRAANATLWNKMAKEKTARAVTQQAYDYLVNVRGYDPRQAAVIASASLDKLGEEWATAERTRDMGEGATVRAPSKTGPGFDTWTAPKSYQHGAEVALFDPNQAAPSSGPPMLSPGAPGGMGGAPMLPSAPILGDLPNTAPGRPPMPPPSLPAAAQGPGVSGAPMLPPGGASGLPGMPSALRRFRMSTEAEQYADSLYPRGSPEWRNAVQDAQLKEIGPTGFRERRQLQANELGVSVANNIRTTTTERDNNIRSTDASVGNNRRSVDASLSNTRNRPAATGVDAKGNTVLIYPDNRVVTTHGIRPVSSTRGRGRGGAAGGGFVPDGATATGPGGQKIVRRGGRWLDMRTGQPVQ
jgi:hypothetical protein